MSRRSKTNGKKNRFKFLLDHASDLGAIEAKIISSQKIVVEDRVLLKCKSGCHMYGHKLICPPFAPTPDEFRKMLKEYDAALIVKFGGKAETEEDVGRSLLKNECAPDVSPDIRERTRKFWDEWNKDKKRILLAMLELEKAAFNQGYTLALALTAGSCTLCEKCNTSGLCTHPSMARYPEHALGVNVKKTLKNANMSIRFPFEKKPEGIGILLID